MSRLPLARKSPAGDYAARRRSGLIYPWRRLAVGALVVAVIGILAAGVGSVGIPPLTVIKIVASRAPLADVAQSWPDTWDTIVWQLRLPRIVLAGIVGAALAMSGATYQGLFRNPLADPYLIGVASGAGLGASAIGASLIGASPSGSARFSSDSTISSVFPISPANRADYVRESTASGRHDSQNPRYPFPV